MVEELDVARVVIRPVLRLIGRPWTSTSVMMFGDIVRVDVEQARRRIERCPRPVRSAVEAGDDDRSLQARRVEGRPAADLSQSGEDRRAVGLADVGDVRLIEKLGGERRRLDRDRLRRRRLFAGNVGGGHGLFLDVEERLAGLAVEQEDIARLRHLRDGVDLLAVVRDRDQVGIDRQIVVPQVVMQRLKVPDALARPGVESDRAVGEQVVAMPVAAVEVEGGRSESGEDQAALHVDAEPAPGIGRAAVLPGIAFPGLVSEFARIGARSGTARPRSPVRTSNARMSPGAAMPGPSPHETPTMIVSFQMAGADVGP